MTECAVEDAVPSACSVGAKLSRDVYCICIGSSVFICVTAACIVYKCFVCTQFPLVCWLKHSSGCVCMCVCVCEHVNC